jgi:t-SNARE complex subunit (syntaxin)
MGKTVDKASLVCYIPYKKVRFNLSVRMEDIQKMNTAQRRRIKKWIVFIVIALILVVVVGTVLRRGKAR